MLARNRIAAIGRRRAVLMTLGLAAFVVGACDDDPALVEPAGPAAEPAAVAPAITSDVAPASSVTFVGAGDIANCSGSGDEATAALIDTMPGTVFTAGDNAYSDGSALNFSNCYQPSWGKFKDRTRPAPGNHDYHTSNGSGYYAYYGANAGPSGRGYYSYDLGAWHIVSLNSNVSMSAGSVQEQWLRADLAASSAVCVLAYWHHPRWSSGTSHGSFTGAQGVWQALYDLGADVVIEGHEHNYERFAPKDGSGALDNAFGIRSFVVGTGGVGHYNDKGTAVLGSEVFNGTAWGVMRFTLSDAGYTWKFIPVPGQTFTDAGQGDCHGKPGSAAPPPPPPGATLSAVTLTPGAASVQVNATKQFTASDSMSDGSTNVFTGAYSATGGTVSANGLYTAGATAGTFRVIAAEGGKADTSAVTVTVAPPPAPTLKTIGVSPSPSTVDTGATKQFAAVDTMSDGSTKSFAGTWAATGGTVSGTGLYEAGTAAGNYRVIATEGARADTVAVTINAPTSTTPPPPSGGSVVAGPADRVVLTPADTLPVGSLGTVGALTARAYNGTQEVATPIKWWMGSSSSVATFSSDYTLCTSPCSMAVTALTVGVTKVIIHEYRKGSTAKTDTTFIKVTGSGSPPPSSQPPPTGVSLAQVVVSPGSASLNTGAAKQFSASGVMSDGSTSGLSTAAWSATGGNVTSGGMYTAGTTAGTFRVIGASGGKADTASITVTAPTAPPPPTTVTLTQVVVTPGSASLNTGATQQFSASGVMSDGSTSALSAATWSATGGSVTSWGLYTAGTTAGTFRVIGASGGKADTASITVMAPPPPPSSSPPAGTWAMGCPSSGYTRLVNVSTKSQLDAALSGAQPGDQIRVAAGTYTGQTGVYKSGTAQNPIVFCGVKGTGPVLHGGFKLIASYVTITGLVFEGPTGGSLMWFAGGDHTQFIGNEVRNSDSHCGVCASDNSNFRIAYNYIHDNGGGAEIDHGIYYHQEIGTGNSIDNNLITRSTGRGISLHDTGGGLIHDILIANNTIWRNGSTGILIAANGGTGNIVANNILADNSVTYSYKQVRIKNGSPDASVLNNIVWSPDAANAGIEAISGTTISGNLAEDPKFVAPYTDLHLQAGSPAVGLAVPQYVMGPDSEGKVRDSDPDAGAYER